jgi:hypothetical protein
MLKRTLERSRRKLWYAEGKVSHCFDEYAEILDRVYEALGRMDDLRELRKRHFLHRPDPERLERYLGGLRLTWPHSAVVTDLKREIFELTAGWRGTEGKNRILRFEPASSTHSVAFNPLDEISLGTDHETGDMQNLATLIVDPDGKGLHTHWQKTACALMTGCISHVLYRQKKEKIPATLPAVDDLLSDPDKTAHEVWTDMITYLHENGATIPIVRKLQGISLTGPKKKPDLCSPPPYPI